MNISRFYEPQKLFFDVALREIKAGCKQSHWMRYIFPQLKSLKEGNQSVVKFTCKTAREYAFKDMVRKFATDVTVNL